MRDNKEMLAYVILNKGQCPWICDECPRELAEWCNKNCNNYSHTEEAKWIEAKVEKTKEIYINVFGVAELMIAVL